MGFNLPQNILYCQQIVQDVAGILYYSHIPSAIAVLLIGYYVRAYSNSSLLGKILFSISLLFSLWVISNLLIWVFYYQNNVVMAVWAPIEVLAVLIYILFLYFTYVFINKREPNLWSKIIAITPFFLLAAVTTTKLNLEAYDIQECIAVTNSAYESFVLALKIFYSSWIIIFALYQFWKANPRAKIQIILLTIGITIFLLSFLIAGFIAVQTDIFIYEAAGLFGMVVFVGFLGYLIVQFNAFDIKVIAAQALVTVLVFLIASQFFFILSDINRILTGITLFLSIGFGYFLVRNVKREIQQREKIERLAVDLEKANTELKEIDRQKDSLISIVSHQLNTPVTAVKWNIEMFLDGDLGQLSEEQTRQLHTMQSETNNLLDLVSMLLDVSRIQLGRMQVNRAPLNLQEFFQESLAEMRPLAEQGLVKITSTLPTEWPTANLDKRLVRMTLQNLLSNAIKYTPKGGAVSLRVEVRDEKLSYQVQDTGCGIPKAEQSRMFEKLFRASNVVNAKEGNGLGMFVAKGAVEAQGGSIRFESTEDKGTTFFVELPLNATDHKKA